ncbi:MAG: ABC transporter substrate-binding protein [Sphingomonadales bacterium]
MKNIRLLATLLLTGIAFGTAGPAAANAKPSQTASQLVGDFHDSLLGVMKQGPELGFAGRAQKLTPTIERTFALRFMCRLIVGAQWSELDQGQRQTIVDAFKQWVISHYASEFKAFDGEAFTTQGVVPGNRDTLVVETSIAPKNDAPVRLGYRLLDGQVIDIYLDGSVSQLALWRAQFAAVLKQDGVDGLVARLRNQSLERAQP